MRSFSLITALAWFAIQAVHAQSTPPEPMAIEAALEHAYLRHDHDGVIAATAQLDAARSRDLQSARLAYLKGFVHFAAAHADNPAKNKPAAIAELEAAVRVLAPDAADVKFALLPHLQQKNAP